MAPPLFKVVAVVKILPPLMVLFMIMSGFAEATWCVARSDASDQSLQTALDYACSSGADCAPLQSSGLCFLPNTIQAHASYAYNSYYQRKSRAPGSCDFAGTAAVARTDPSYGSCVYPSSPSTAGGPIVPGGGGTTTPTIYAPPPPLMGTTTPISNGGLTPRMGPVIPDSSNHGIPLQPPMFKTPILMILHLVLLFVFQSI